MPLCEIPYTWPRTASKQASKQASKWLHAACFTLTLASLPATGCDSEPEYVDQELIGPFDADDGQTVRVHDFIASDPTVLYRMQMDHEIPFYRGPREAPHGTRVSIVSTGYYARELGRQYDLVVEGHRRTIRAPRGESVGVAQEPVNCSAGVPVDDPLFPWYDPDGAAFNGGIATELESMHNPTIGINVSSIGTSLEGRDIFAVQIGPREPVGTTPTVYLAGTYHAREWVTTAVMMELTRWLRDVASSGGAIEGTLYADLYDRAVVLVPVVNVDGYQYTRTESVSGDPGREHRKNRRNTCETLDGLADGVT